MKQQWIPKIGDTIWIIDGNIGNCPPNGLYSVKVLLTEHNYWVLAQHKNITKEKTYNVFKTERKADKAIKEIQTILTNSLIKRNKA